MIKKIETQEDKDKKAQRNKLIIGIVLVVLIGLSSMGYAIMSRNDSSQQQSAFSYAGLTFVQSNGIWATTINGKTVYFNSLPNETENVSITGNFSFSDYANQVVYFVNENPAANGIYSSLQDIATRMQETCLSGMNCTNPSLPIKNCTSNVIVFTNQQSATRVYKQQNCVFIEGDFFKGADRFLYRLYNII